MQYSTVQHNAVQCCLVAEAVQDCDCRRGRGGAAIADMRPLTGKAGCSPWHALPSAGAGAGAGAGAESPLAASRWTFVQPGCGCGLQSWAGPCTCRGQGVFTIRWLRFTYLTWEKSSYTPQWNFWLRNSTSMSSSTGLDSVKDLYQESLQETSNGSHRQDTTAEPLLANVYFIFLLLFLSSDLFQSPFLGPLIIYNQHKLSRWPAAAGTLETGHSLGINMLILLPEPGEQLQGVHQTWEKNMIKLSNRTFLTKLITLKW